MKTLLRIAVSAIMAIPVLNGCSSDPHVIGYVTPAHLVSQIETSDRIVVVSNFRNIAGASHFAGYTSTITGSEMNEIIRAISSVRAPRYDLPTAPSECVYDWQLQFFRGTNLLGTADLGDCLVRCDGVEYHAPQALRRLYNHIAHESGEAD